MNLMKQTQWLCDISVDYIDPIWVWWKFISKISFKAISIGDDYICAATSAGGVSVGEMV